jgi:hypothetical protein
MSDNTCGVNGAGNVNLADRSIEQHPDAVAIADAMARERASDIAQQSVTERTDDVPTRVYVSWAGQNPRFWLTTPPADMAVTTYVVQSEVDDVTEDRDLWHESEQVCARQFTVVREELDKALLAIQSERERAKVLVEAWREYFAACEQLAECERDNDTTKRFDAALYRQGDAEDMARKALAAYSDGHD